MRAISQAKVVIELGSLDERPDLRTDRWQLGRVKGGDLGAWLAVVARNHAIDYVRRRGREAPSGIDLPDGAAGYSPDLGRQSEARLLVERFAREVLPAEWRPVFEKRLLQSFSQAEAAAALGLSRTTLAYRELRIRLLLRKFLLGDAS